MAETPNPRYTVASVRTAIGARPPPPYFTPEKKLSHLTLPSTYKCARDAEVRAASGSK